MEKIDINNEKEILQKCDFDFFYKSEKCSRELCMFYNDIFFNNRKNFNKQNAFIDLYRIAITLNEQYQEIKKYEEIMKKHNIVGVAKLDACLADYLNVNEDTMSGKIIKQLKEEIKQLKFDCAMYKSANYLINDVGIDKAREIMFQTEKKLKKSQNSKAIEVLEKMRSLITIKSVYSLTYGSVICEYDFLDYILHQIAELKGENNGKL